MTGCIEGERQLLEGQYFGYYCIVKLRKCAIGSKEMMQLLGFY